MSSAPVDGRWNQVMRAVCGIPSTVSVRGVLLRSAPFACAALAQNLPKNSARFIFKIEWMDPSRLRISAPQPGMFEAAGLEGVTASNSRSGLDCFRITFLE
jgi:hypothetical protein